MKDERTTELQHLRTICGGWPRFAMTFDGLGQYVSSYCFVKFIVRKGVEARTFLPGRLEKIDANVGGR